MMDTKPNVGPQATGNSDSLVDRSENERAYYEELVRAHAGPLYRYAFRLCGRESDAEDLVQETFYESWRNISSLKDRTKGKAWMFRILQRRYAQWVREARRQPHAVIPIEDVEDRLIMPVKDRDDAHVDRERLQRALNALDDRYKVPFLMVFMEGLSCREAAEELQVPLGTVLSRIHRARRFLRQRSGP